MEIALSAGPVMMLEDPRWLKMSDFGIGGDESLELETIIECRQAKPFYNYVKASAIVMKV